MNKFTELVKKIREIFQIDRADLDFGIYRILNARSEEISQFLDKELQKQVKQALVGDNSEKLRLKKEELKAKEEHYRQDGVDPDSVPKIKELREEIAGYMSENVDYENEVYSHLLRFFSRYYDKGDFISRRRYKADTYAVPYSGEEVVLHWANKDQYYIKSGEYFSNYSFNLDDGRKVTFKLVSADTAKDNRKDADQNRLFALVEPHVRVRQDEDGDEYEEKIETIVEGNDELVINFVYAPQPGTKQANLVKEALEVLLNKPEISKNWQALLERRPIESNPARTLLEKQLTDYTEKNNADYFIHKDLGGFLRRELDFYIKSEVMNLDDIQHISTFKGIEKNLKMIQCLRLIAGHLIDFMAQLENFQKKLWLKKKFVVETNYCMTLDRIPEEFYDEICKNEAQLEEWVKLFAIDEIKKDLTQPGFSRPLKKAFLKANDKLVLDTKFFSKSFKYRLLSSIDNLDDQCDGLLVHSENLQAVRLIGPRIHQQVSNIFIDPPYNTGDDGFVYKDRYQTSTWLTMIDERVDVGMNLLSGNGVFFASIGDEEQENFANLLRNRYGKKNFFATMIWEKKKKGSFLSGQIARMKDYILCVAKNIQEFHGLVGEIASGEETYPCVNASNPREVRRIPPGIISKFREKDFMMKAGNIISAGTMNLILKSDLVIKEGILAKELIIEGNWRYSQENMSKFALKKELYVTQDLYLRRIVNEPRYKRMKDLLPRIGNDGESDFRAFDLKDLARYGWGTNEDANDELHQLLGEQYAASYPKPSKLLTLLLVASRHTTGYWMDYFAGSGTTGHAVININREDGGKRKFILVDVGENFQTVLKPRILKVIYSKNWSNGKPTIRNTGISNCLKYHKLESYEDTLNNLLLTRAKPQQAALDNVTEKVKSDYLLKYMLDVESRDSLLNTDLFKKPFDYTLNIATDSAGASEPRQVDLIETFNYLIGLKVQKLNVKPDQGQAIVEGITTAGEKVLVIWRDCEKVDYNDLNKLCEKLRINPRDFEYDVLYVNGDHNIPQTITLEAADGGITRTMKLRQIEDEFFRRMFACEEI